MRPNLPSPPEPRLPSRGDPVNTCKLALLLLACLLLVAWPLLFLDLSDPPLVSLRLGQAVPVPHGPEPDRTLERLLAVVAVAAAAAGFWDCRRHGRREATDGRSPAAPDGQELVVVARPFSQAAALVLRSRLNIAGIACAPLEVDVFAGAMSAMAGYAVRVRAEDLDRARQALREAAEARIEPPASSS